MPETDALTSCQVATTRTDDARYPEEPPYSPSHAYPEYRLSHLADEPNHVYAAVRRVLRLAGLDPSRVDTARWNPFGDLVGPGGTVVLKPNLVRERHPRDPDGWRWVLTHGSVIRAAADFAFAAVGPSGRVVVADAPQTDSSFAAIVRVLGLDRLCAFYAGQGLTLGLVDLRQEEWTTVDDVVVDRRRLAGDPGGAIAYDLGDASEFVGHSGSGRYYGADYDSRVVNAHHSGGRHEYLLSGTVMNADLVVNLPKLKSHKKAGVTLGLKNLVGINADKNWLPHHTEGSPRDGGDEHPSPGALHRLERTAVAGLRRAATMSPRLGGELMRLARHGGTHVFGDGDSVIRSGNWWGNDTVWRMCLDLNKILAYGRPDGTLAARPEPGRRHVVLVDGVLAGQRGGPMNPDPLPARLLTFGATPAAVDAATAYLFGFDPDRIPVIHQAFRCARLPLAHGSWRDIELRGDDDAWHGRLGAIAPDAVLRAEPHFAWRGQIELTRPAVPR
ncbi:DUF362 domain-containing protein [Pseudofrankia sp. BMG5.37]|uniref:DUF362 domain-containing protein n=1 Tax=Pseudofrankia sp. BMG5.37 TaxID=3050035 RepID=UPI002895A8A8|nr:DUF362 domain-containing protein [Pseudofrankia sp. BMG5.37]MDT3443973.1 DUF362 domain-containing protein [Pseudofrankia sp. BMG5.37]